MSDSGDESIQGVEAALAQLNISIRGYNQAKQERDGDGHTRHHETSSTLTSHDECMAFAQSVRWSTGGSPFAGAYLVTSTDEHATSSGLQKRLNTLQGLFTFLETHPYSVELYSRIANAYENVGYMDLAAGAAYKALLLLDNLGDEGNEFYEQAFISLAESVSKESLSSRCEILAKYPELQKSLFHPACALKDEQGYETFPVVEEEVKVWADVRYSHQVYTALTRCLHACGCQRSAAEYCHRGLELFPNDVTLSATLKSVEATVREHLGKCQSDDKISIEDYPDVGMVRRECYPWNSHEPDRCSDRSLDELNTEMAKVAPKLVVRATELPALAGQEGTSRQLGVFAREDIHAGEIVLKETSLLTANNRLQDALCDACSADLPEMKDPAFSDVVDCPECSVVFCNQNCYDMAEEEYHPAICDRGVEDIAKNVPPTEAANTLYTLLLLRALAMAETQQCHPLDLKYVKYIWGDYHAVDLFKHWIEPEGKPSASTLSPYPRALPFSFQANVVLPFNMLEMMDIDVFLNPQYDVWVFNTLYAKFRGTASARLSGLSGRPIRGPEVSAVHPNWCLANHSCDPNVTWNWSSEVKFRVLEERVKWQSDGGGAPRRSEPGLKEGEEVLSHYCDIDLPVKERREWAAGSLGGNCLCERCCAEASHTSAQQAV